MENILLIDEYSYFWFEYSPTLHDSFYIKNMCIPFDILNRLRTIILTQQNKA